VSFGTGDDAEKVIVSVTDAEFSAETGFRLEDVSSDLFRLAVLRSGEIAGRLFQEPQLDIED